MARSSHSGEAKPRPPFAAIWQAFNGRKMGNYEPRPKGRGMIWEEFRTPPKFGFELPGPEGSGFWKPDQNTPNLKKI